MHKESRDDSSGSRKNHKGREILNPTPVREYLVVDLFKDNDMNFYSTHNVHSIDCTPRAHYDVERIYPEVEGPNDSVSA